MEKLKTNKRGAIGQTLTWIVGAFLIFIMLLIFLAIVTLLVGLKNINPLDNSKVKFNEIENADYRAWQSFDGFLYSDVNGEHAYLLLDKQNDQAFNEAFKIKAKNFLDKSFLSKEYRGSWIKVYVSGQEKYKISSRDCDEDDKNSFVDSVSANNNPGTKIEICAERKL